MKLVIIEGIGKKETIEKYLGAGYRVFATKGHVRDLPSKTLAVDVKNNFAPRYEIMPDKKEIVTRMKEEAAKADEVLLATDPDREGEAISWHVANILNIPLNKKARIVFNEISKNAVTNALKAPREIDVNLVDAQQARRVLDRLVGYKVSPILCKRIKNKLSAGRVQSATLRIIIDREREILDFKPEEYWPFYSVLNKGTDFKATLATFNGKKIKLHSKQEVDKVLSDINGREYVVTDVVKSIAKTNPFAPFITSSMQQDALNKLNMSLAITTKTAQTLYEGVDIPGEGKVALVTYIRTDSTRVSDDAIKEARSYIEGKYGKDYIPEKPNLYSKKQAQDAHEAIRPITVSRTPESLKGIIKDTQYKLYKLIYERFLASQMSPAKYDALNVDIQCGNYGFKVSGKTMLFPGFTAVYNAFVDDKEEDGGANAKLPALVKGDVLKFVKYIFEQKFTKPPSRYTEASLIKVMEEKGIGRPATYNPTVALIFDREYVQKEGKYIKPTDLGFEVNDMLIKYFPDIINVKFTAEMEEKLDKIEESGTWQGLIADFYRDFEKELKVAYDDKLPDEESEFSCPDCGSPMVYKNGRYGKFLACTGYPKCKCTRPIDENGNPTEQKKAEVSDVVCELCGKPMVYKNGKYGRFLGCSGYPKCKNIVNLDEKGQKNEGQEQKEKLPACPDCGKPLQKKNGRTPFYGCSGYPNCRFASRYMPIEGSCPTCGGYLVTRKIGDKPYIVCGKNCGYKQESSQEPNQESAQEPLR